jgi:hypothetical protein
MVASAAAIACPSSHAQSQTPPFAQVSIGFVASNVLAYPNPAGSIGTNWGWHQSRIVRDSSGQVSLVYLVNPTVTSPLPTSSTWRLMSCCTSSGWYEVTHGTTLDDVYLLVDPVTQRKTVIAYPQGVPVAYPQGNGYQATVIDTGTWPVTSGYSGPRQYGGAGIGSDGTMCVKASHEFGTTYGTTDTDLICGKYDSTGKLTWGGHSEKPQGDRAAYDYIYPGGTGGAPEVMATSQRDVCILDSQNKCTNNYSFNGVDKWDAGISGTTITSFSASTFYPPSSNAYDTRRQLDSLVMSNSLVLSVVQIKLQGQQNSTFQLKVLDPSTNQFTDTNLPLPTWGFVRLMEPYPGSLYLLWTGRGSSTSEARIYALTKDTSNGVRYVLDSNYQDVSSQIFPSGQMIQDNVYVTAARGGSLASRNIVDGYYLTCAGTCTNYEPLSLYHFTLKF